MYRHRNLSRVCYRLQFHFNRLGNEGLSGARSDVRICTYSDRMSLIRAYEPDTRFLYKAVSPFRIILHDLLDVQKCLISHPLVH